MLVDAISKLLGSFHFYYGVAVTAIVAGLVMAYLTEDGAWETNGDPNSANSKSVAAKAKMVDGFGNMELFMPKNFVGKVYRHLYSISGFSLATLGEVEAWYWGPDPIEPTSIVARIFKLMFRLFTLLRFYCEAKTLYHLADSKTHYMYLLQKRCMGIETRQGESELSSYLSIKKYLGEKWPFMWEVGNVTDELVTCGGQKCHPMSSYSYLNLLRDPRVQDHAIESAKLWAPGNHGPRMLGGNTTILRDLEKQIAEFFGREDSLLCCAGFLATMSACAGVSSERDVLFADSRSHASLRTGLKIAAGKVFYFKHDDFKDLEALMIKHRHNYNNAWIVIESVYSMDGDIANLPACNDVAKKFDAKIIIDEAHGLGVLGKHGRGLEDHYNMPGTATIICGTFSKSASSVGGYITASKEWISFLDFYAPGNVFSAPLPAYNAGAAMASFKIMVEEPEHMLKAQENSRYFRHCLETGMGQWPADYPPEHKFIVEGHPATTVIPLIFADDIDRVMRVAHSLRKRGYMVSAVAYPACPIRKPRFRLTATSAYTKELIEEFVTALIQICIEEPPSKTMLLLQQLTA